MPDEDSLELELEMYKKEAEELASRREELKRRKTALQQKIEQRQGQLQQELDPLIILLEQYIQEVRELEDNKQAFENTIENKQETLADIRERRKKLETVLNKYKEGYAAKKEELHAQVRNNIQAKIQRIQELKLKSSELESKREELEPKYHALEKQHQEIEAELSELKSQLESINSQSSELERELDEAQKGKKGYIQKARTVIASSKEKFKGKIREKEEGLSRLIATDDKETAAFEKEREQNQTVTKRLSEKRKLIEQTQLEVDEKTKYINDLTRRREYLGAADLDQPSLKVTELAEDALKRAIAPKAEDLVGLEEAMLKPEDLEPAYQEEDLPSENYAELAGEQPSLGETLPEDLEPAPPEEDLPFENYAELGRDNLDGLETSNSPHPGNADQLIAFVNQIAVDTPSTGREFSDIREDEADDAVNTVLSEGISGAEDEEINGALDNISEMTENEADGLLLPIEDVPSDIIYLDEGVKLSPLLKDSLNEKLPGSWNIKEGIIPAAEICYKNQDSGDITIQFVDSQAFLEKVKDYAHQMIISSTRQIMGLDEIENPEIDSEERSKSFSHSWSRIKEMLTLFFENYNPSIETVMDEYAHRKKVDDNFVKFADIESGKGLVLDAYLQAVTRRDILPALFEQDQIDGLYKGTLTEQPIFRPTINLGRLVDSLTSKIKELDSPDYPEKVGQSLEALGFLLEQRGYTVSKAD